MIFLYISSITREMREISAARNAFQTYFEKGFGNFLQNRKSIFDRWHNDCIIFILRIKTLKNERPKSPYPFQAKKEHPLHGCPVCRFGKKQENSRFIETAITLVRVTGFEPTASWSRTKRATSCATPGFYAILVYRPQNSVSRGTKGTGKNY